ETLRVVRPLAENFDVSFGGTDQSRHEIHKCRLARAVWSDQARDAWADFQIDAIDAEDFAVELGDIGEDDLARYVVHPWMAARFRARASRRACIRSTHLLMAAPCRACIRSTHRTTSCARIFRFKRNRLNKQIPMRVNQALHAGTGSANDASGFRARAARAYP